MNTIIELIPFGFDAGTWEPVGWMLVHSIWILTLLAGLFLFFRFAIRSARPDNHAEPVYWLGCATMLAMVSSLLIMVCQVSGPDFSAVSFPVVLVEGSINANADSPTPGSSVRLSQPSATTMFDPTFLDQTRWMLTGIVWLWMVGVVLVSIRPLLGWRTVNSLRRNGKTRLPQAIETLAADVAENMRIKAAVTFTGSILVEVPTVIGYLKPLVLLPTSALTGLSTHQLRLILAHELAHVRRQDYVINFLQTLIETVLFYHPAVWWVSAQVRIERENCCDDVAVTLYGNRKSYSHALMMMEESRAISPPALGASGGSLVSRIRRLMKESDLSTPSPKATRLRTMGMVACLPAVVSFALIAGVIFSASESLAKPAGQKIQEPTRVVVVETKTAKSDEEVAEILRLSRMKEGNTPLIGPSSLGLSSFDGVFLAGRLVDKEELEAQPRLQMRTYRVADLIVPPAAPAGLLANVRYDGKQWMAETPDGSSFPTQTKVRIDERYFAPIIDLIKNTISPDSWEESGTGLGSIQPFNDSMSLVIAQTAEVHDEIRNLLQTIRNLNDVTLYTRGFLVVYDSDEIKQHFFTPKEGAAVLGKTAASTLRGQATVSDSMDVLDLPSTEIFNGQIRSFDFGQFAGMDSATVKIRLVTSVDRKSVEILPLTQKANAKIQSLAELGSNAWVDFASPTPVVLESQSGQFVSFDISHLLRDQDNRRAILCFRVDVLDATGK